MALRKYYEREVEAAQEFNQHDRCLRLASLGCRDHKQVIRFDSLAIFAGGGFNAK